jgi:parallel beta-helix repeat protein
MARSKKQKHRGDAAAEGLGETTPPVRETRPRAVILTALPVEYQAVRAHLSEVREQIHEQGTVYEEGVFSGEQEWDVSLVEIGAGNVTTAAEAERAMQHFHPRVLLFVGVAGGLKDARVGDVVIATKVYGYESGKAGSEFSPRPAVLTPSYRLEQRARAEARKKDWLTRAAIQLGDLKPRAMLGPIAAGEKVVASRASEISQFIQQNYGDSLAIEMEGHGLLEAASLNERVEALVVRGISDLLDKKDHSDAAGSQETAAALAAAFAFELLGSIGPATATPLPGIARMDAPQSLPKYPPSQAQAPSRIVDQKGNGDHRTLSEAITAATPGEQILIKPGLYTEQLLLEKVLELIGEGKTGDVVVQCNATPCLTFAATMGRVSNITFRQLGEADLACIDILHGRLELETCSVSSQTDSGVWIHDGADPRIRYSNFHDNKKAGILGFLDGLGTIEENTLVHNGGAGVEITGGSSPTVRNNTIRDNRGPGIFIHDSGIGVLDGNDIFGNETGISASDGSSPTILRNKIHDNMNEGVSIANNAEGVIEFNTIIGNSCGIKVTSSSRATIRGNRIQGASRSGVHLGGHSSATVEANQLSGHSYFGIFATDQSEARIRGNRIFSCSASGIRVADKTSAYIERNSIFRNRHLGVDAEDVPEILIRSNRIRRNESFGVRVKNVDTVTLENNDLRENREPRVEIGVKTQFVSGNNE